MKRTHIPGAMFDGDASVVSELSRRRRARTSVADAEAAYRADIVLAFIAAQGDLGFEAAVLADAARYDRLHPDEPSLVEEACAAVAGDEPGLVAA
jgi:hypothetical protein